MQMIFAAADGARLAYRDEGPRDGLPVLCLAGLTRNMADFDDALPALADCRVIRMDYRGRGDSAGQGPPPTPSRRRGRCAGAAGPSWGREDRGPWHLARGADRDAAGGSGEGPSAGPVPERYRPEIHRPGLERIKDYVGRRPAARTLAEVAARLPGQSPGFAGVSPAQWAAMAARLYAESERGLELRYDPALREAFLAAFDSPPADLWPLWEATKGLPVALIRGANSDLLTADCVARMQSLRPDMGFADVPDRAHVPFLDEPEAVAVIRRWIGAMA